MISAILFAWLTTGIIWGVIKFAVVLREIVYTDAKVVVKEECDKVWNELVGDIQDVINVYPPAICALIAIVVMIPWLAVQSVMWPVSIILCNARSAREAQK